MTVIYKKGWMCGGMGEIAYLLLTLMVSVLCATQISQGADPLPLPISPQTEEDRSKSAPTSPCDQGMHTLAICQL